MILSLISGTLFRKPEERTSQAGKYYVAATIKVANGNIFYFIRVMFFNEENHPEILEAQCGDAIAVTGPLSVEIYDNGRGPRPSLNLIANRVLLLKREKRSKQKPVSAEVGGAAQF